MQNTNNCPHDTWYIKYVHTPSHISGTKTCRDCGIQLVLNEFELQNIGNILNDASAAGRLK